MVSSEMDSARAGFVCAMVAVAFWSTNALAAKFALADLGVVQVLALQFGGASGLLVVLSLAGFGKSKSGVELDSRRPSRVLGGAVIGVVGLTGTIFFQYLAFASAPIVEANVLAYGWPLFAAVWAALVYRSRQAIAGIPLAVVGFIGVAIILVSGGGFGSAEGGAPGYVAALLSAVCMTFFTVMSGRHEFSIYVLLLPATLFGAILALTLCASGFADWEWNSAGSGAWISAVYAGIGPMAGGFLLWSRAMSGDGVERLAPLGYATPLVSTVLLIFSGERFGAAALIGASLILICSVGVMFLDRTKRH